MPFKPSGEWPIPMGRVKLPEPLTSDYLVPSLAICKALIEEDFDTAPSGWSWSTSGSAPSYTAPATDEVYQGTGSLKIYKHVSSGFLYSGSGVYSKSFDLTNVNIITFFVKASESNASFTFALQIDGSNVWSTSSATDWTKISVDVSSYTGTHTIGFSLSYPEIDSTSAHYIDVWVDLLQFLSDDPSKVADNDTSTIWSAGTSDNGEWIYIDLSAPTIVGGARIYWGSNVPKAYRIQASTDASTWYDVYSVQAPPQANSWAEYSWPAVYARYLRLYFDDTGGTAPEVAEFQYYSQITDRVAAEHGHGSGVEPWKEGVLTSALKKAMGAGPVKPKVARIRGFTVKARILKKLSELQKAGKVTPEDLSELTELLLEYADMLNP